MPYFTICCASLSHLARNVKRFLKIYLIFQCYSRGFTFDYDSIAVRSGKPVH